MAYQMNNNGGSSTCVVEMQDIPEARIDDKDSERISNLPRRLHSSDRRPESVQNVSAAGRRDEPADTLPSPSTAVDQVQRWNHPRRNVWKSFAAFWSFVVMGMNDAAFGALIPYIGTYYSLSYTVVSLIFLSPLAGYMASSLLNNTVHLRYGQRGVAVIGPTCHLAAYIATAVHPPYPVLVVLFTLSGFGNGLEDAAWNAWIGAMANANEVLGVLHGFYGLGATLSPLIATTMITKGDLPWYSFYYFMIGTSALELATSAWAFWESTAKQYREQHPRTTASNDHRLVEALVRRPSARITWLCALFLLGYVGIEVTLGGWIVTFMQQVRNGSPFASGMTATGFWLGITIGRVILGFITPRIGEKRAIIIYLPIIMGLELLFWLVPQFYVSAVAVSLQGFFLGPMFPAAVVAATKLLPRHLHVSAIGFAAAIGGTGAAIFPFAVGAIAQAKGVQVLQPIVLALLAMIWLTWMALPRMKRRDE